MVAKYLNLGRDILLDSGSDLSREELVLLLYYSKNVCLLHLPVQLFTNKEIDQFRNSKLVALRRRVIHAPRLRFSLEAIQAATKLQDTYTTLCEALQLLQPNSIEY